MFRIITTISLSLSFLTVVPSFLPAQNSFGFRAGMNLNRLIGDTEPGEVYESSTGFHIGLGLGRNFTDIWGVRGELVYSQKGGLINFDGDSFLTFDRGERKITHTGTRNASLTVNNTHIDLPITGFGRLANWIELSAGIVPSFTVASRGVLDLQFSSPAINQDISLNTEYNYYGNRLGQVNGLSETIEVKERATANTLTLPSMPGAYYFQETKNGNKYNIFGLDAVAGASLFVNSGLFFGVRVQYGLLDITNNNEDYSQATPNELRADRDVNLTYQYSVGFYF